MEVWFYYHDFHKKSIMKKKAGSLMNTGNATKFYLNRK